MFIEFLFAQERMIEDKTVFSNCRMNLLDVK